MVTDIVNFKKQKKRKYKRWIIKIIYILFGLYFLVDFLLFFVATPILKSYLQDKISKQTNGLFSVDFENISIELASRRLALKKFELISDSNVYNKLIKQNKEIPALYNISCSSLEIHRTSIYNIFFKKRLKAKELKLIDLIIELKRLPVGEQNYIESRDFVHQDLFPAISSYLTEIKIEEIKVINGKFNLDLNQNAAKKTTHLGYVSVNLYNFFLNKTEHEQRKRLFFADDLQINIDEYKINLSDKIHFIFAQDLNISTRESRLTAKNSGIAPLNQSDKFLNSLQNNYYHINAPFIEMDNFNIYDLYFNKDINIGKVIIKRPKIDVVNVLQPTKEARDPFSKTKEIDLSKLIAGKLNTILVDTFRIDEGKLNFYYGNKKQLPTYKAKSLSLALYRFKLDEKTFNDQKKVFYSDDIDLDLSDFNAQLPDFNTLSVSTIKIRTAGKFFYSTDITLKPNSEQLSLKSPVKINIPNLEISGTDFSKLYHKRIFNIASLTIGNSEFDIVLYGKGTQQEENQPKKNILAGITSNFLRQISIHSLKLKDSHFKIRNEINDSTFFQYKGVANFSLFDFFVDENSFSPDKRDLFFSKNFTLQLKNYNQDLNDGIHQIFSNSVEVSTKDSMIEINDFKINRKDLINNLNLNEWIFNVHMLQVSIKGIDIKKAYSDSIFEARSFSIFRPEFIIEHYTDFVNKKVFIIDSSLLTINYQNDSVAKKAIAGSSPFKHLIESYFSKINLGALNIENADFSIIDIDSAGKKDISTNCKISAKLSEIKHEGKDTLNRKISYSNNISFKISDYFSKIFDKKYQLKVKLAKFSSKDSVFSANLVRLFPVPEYEDSLTNPFLFSFYAPEISTSQTNISELISSKILDLGYLIIKNPSIAGIQTDNKNVSSDMNKKKEIREPFLFDKIRFSGITIDKGVFGILKKLQKKESPLLTASIELQAKSFEIDSSSILNPRIILSNLDALASFRNIQYLLPDSLHFLKINHLEINALNKEISGDSLYYLPIMKVANFQEKQGLEELFIPYFKSTDFNFEKLIFDKAVVTEKLEINKPDIYFLGKEKSSKVEGFDMSKLNLNGKFKNKIKLIDIRKISLSDAKLSLSPAKEVVRNPKIYKKLFANITGLKIDSLLKKDERLLNSDDMNVWIEDYSYDFADNLYTIFFKNIGISTGTNKIYSSGLELNPTLSREEYGELKKTENSLSYLKSSQIVVSGFDIKSFIEKGDIIAKSTEIENLQFHTFKNNKYPLNLDLKVPLPLKKLLNYQKLVKIDTISFKNAYLGHEILGQDAHEYGFVDFTKINGGIYNLTNSKEAILGKQNTTMVVSGYFMDKSLLTTSFHFPLDSKYGEYYYGGELDTFEMQELNPLIENLAFISVTNGIVNNLKFEVSANEDYAEGKLKMLYKDLKIELLNKKKTDSIETEKRELFSMFANSILRNSNPKHKNGFIKEGRIYFERNVFKPVFNYWILSVLSGIKSTMGFKSKELKERLKIEKSTEKYSSRKIRKTARFDRKNKKAQQKQIDKEIKQELKKRKRSGNKEKNNQNQ